MTEIKAIEELRELSEVRMDGWLRMDTQKIADEIEAEIEREWMRVPVDADGVPIHVGDELVYTDECGREFDCIVTPLVTYEPKCYRHVRPRTIEDVLADFAADVENDRNDHETARKYADEIRELMEAGDEHARAGLHAVQARPDARRG